MAPAPILPLAAPAAPIVVRLPIGIGAASILTEELRPMSDELGHAVRRIIAETVADQVRSIVKIELRGLAQRIRSALEEASAADEATASPVKVGASGGRGKHRHRQAKATGKSRYAVVRYRGREQSPAAWVKELRVPGLNRMLVISRLHRGWEPAKALTTPPMEGRGRPAPRQAKKAPPPAPSKGQREPRGKGAHGEVVSAPTSSTPKPPAALQAPVPVKSEPVARTPASAEGSISPEMLPGRLAMLFAAIAAGIEVSDADRALLDLPEAQNVTPRRRALARAVLREEPALVPRVISGALSLPGARQRARKHMHRVGNNGPAERTPLDEVPPLSPWAASLTASSSSVMRRSCSTLSVPHCRSLACWRGSAKAGTSRPRR